MRKTMQYIIDKKEFANPQNEFFFKSFACMGQKPKPYSPNASSGMRTLSSSTMTPRPTGLLNGFFPGAMWRISASAAGTMAMKRCPKPCWMQNSYLNTGCIWLLQS